MLNFYMLSSGSRGNSTIIWDENDIIIIDCGISMKKFSEKTSELNIENLEKSIFISHEHSDEILSRQLDDVLSMEHYDDLILDSSDDIIIK